MRNLFIAVIFFLIAGGKIFGQLHPDSTLLGLPGVHRGTQASIDFCYGDFKTTNSFDGKQLQPKTGYSVSFIAFFKGYGNYGLETGLGFAERGYAETFNELTYGDMIDPRKGFLYSTTSVPRSITFVNTLQYIQLPLKFQVYGGRRKLKFSFGVGALVQYHISSTRTLLVDYEDGTHQRNREVASRNGDGFNLSPAISVGIACFISRNIYLRLEPTFQYGLVTTTGTGRSANLYNGGLNFTFMRR